MPITLYQITAKFRNEERPRFGVLRTSEFLMKDAYSFDASVESLGRSYDAMYKAYCRIFDRCRAELSGGGGRERADRRRRQPRVHGARRQRRGHGAALRGVRLRGQPGEGRDRGPRLHAARRAAGAAPPGGHAGREHDRAGQPIPRSAGRRTSSRRSSIWPTESRSRSWSAATTRRTRAKSAGRVKPRPWSRRMPASGSNWPRRK